MTGQHNKLVGQDKYQFHDYYGVDDLLTEEHLLIRSAVRDWVKKEVSPIIEDCAQKAEFPRHIVKKLGEIGAFGPSIPAKYGGGGMDEISYGIIMQELERGDSGIRSTASVQGSLVMYPIYKFGSEEQKMKYIPKLATGELFGCFGLTEPNHGSDPSSMETRFEDKGDHYLLNGAKMWISNAPYADIAVVWGKNDEGKVQGLIVERGMEGFSTPTTHGKWSLRASCTGELVFDNVKVPKENLLPGVASLRGIAWGAIGCALDCYDSALRYSQERIQFQKPIGQFQLTQKKLAEMITEITKAQLMVWRLGVLKNEGKATPAQISMAKRNSCDIALKICREARQIHGGMGITGEYPIMLHLLITGMDVTGLNAFK